MVSRDLEEFKEWENSRNGFWTNFKKTMQPTHVIGLAVCLLLGIYFFQTSSGGSRNFIIGAVVIIGLIVIYRTGGSKEKIPIPDHIMKKLVQRLMDRKIGTEYPYGTEFHLIGYCGMRFQGEYGQGYAPWKWETGLLVIYPDGLRKTLLIVAHVYDGYITKILGKPAGYNGEDSNDLKVLLPTQFIVSDDKKGEKK